MRLEAFRLLHIRGLSKIWAPFRSFFSLGVLLDSISVAN